MALTSRQNSWSESWLLLQLSCSTHPGRHQMRAKQLGPCHPCRRPRLLWSLGFILAQFWLAGLLRSQSLNESFSLFPHLSSCHYFFFLTGRREKNPTSHNRMPFFNITVLHSLIGSLGGYSDRRARSFTWVSHTTCRLESSAAAFSRPLAGRQFKSGAIGT